MVPKKDEITRRDLLAPAAAGLALTLVPRHVLGGPGYVAPSDKITIACVGCGTQGTREMLQLMATPEIQITAVCDPVKVTARTTSIGARTAFGDERAQ